MPKPTTQFFWAEFLETFSRQNHHRKTRLGVFERDRGAMTDYWLEDGLPLEGISVEMRPDTAPTVEIMLGAVAESVKEHFTHCVHNVRFVKIILSVNGESDGLEIEDANGTTTILRFENFE